MAPRWWFRPVERGSPRDAIDGGDALARAFPVVDRSRRSPPHGATEAEEQRHLGEDQEGMNVGIAGEQGRRAGYEEGCPPRHVRQERRRETNEEEGEGEERGGGPPQQTERLRVAQLDGEQPVHRVGPIGELDLS